MNGHLFLVPEAEKGKTKVSPLFRRENLGLGGGMQPSSSLPVQLSLGVKSPPQSLSRCPH